MNSFYAKYLKYKNKYLKIKGQVGGDKEITVIVNGEKITLSFPDRFLCPISETLFVDPVIASDGVTYEQNHIVDWLKRNNTSPFTGVMLPDKMLIPNGELKAEIEKFKLDGYQRLKGQKHDLPKSRGASAVSAVDDDDGFSMISSCEDFSIISGIPDTDESQTGKIPLPWKKPAADIAPLKMTKQERKIYFTKCKAENDAFKQNPAVIIYENLFQKSMFSVLDGINLVEKYATAPTDDKDAISKYLSVILYCYQSLQHGSTSWTFDTMSLGEDTTNPKIKEERLQRLRLAAQLVSLKLNSIGETYENYFAPKTVEIMKRLFR